MAGRGNDTQLKVSHRKRRIFLRVLRATGKVVQAAQAAGYQDSDFLRQIYNKDESFKEEWDAAIEAAADMLEDEAFRRAHEGVMEPVYHQGEVAGFKVVYSDGLLKFLLSGMRPRKYRESIHVDNRLDIQFGVALLPVAAVTMEDWERAAITMHADQEVGRISPPPMARVALTAPRSAGESR